MGSMSLPQRRLSSSQISVAAESIVAAQFALSGFDVLEKPGRARSFHDLGVARSGGMLKLSVHASFNGFWDLADPYLDRPLCNKVSAEDYHRAIDLWREHHNSQVKCCLVEFEAAALNAMPRIYLATAAEVAAALHQKIDQLTCDELGPLGLDIVHRAQSLPPTWRFSQERIAELMELPVQEKVTALPLPGAAERRESSTVAHFAHVEHLPLMN
jgi:hypothetical protein